MKKPSKKTAAGIAIIVVMTAVLAVAIYIMVTRMGLADNLDFGAGAYYYADIPDYEKVDASFATKVPRWVHILLFLAWGALMYKLWKFVDKDPEDK